MKYIVLTILTLLFLLPQQAKAEYNASEEIVKVLMLGSANDSLPSDEAETIGTLTGTVFINGKFYSGSLEVIEDENGLYLINSFSLEKYIEAAVASEIGNDWDMEALKAQAVIARTEAAFYKNVNAEKKYHLSSAVLHRLYENNGMDPLIMYAVKETGKEILTYENRPIKAFYHTTCEGKTEIPEEVWEESYPYLKSVNCNIINAPYKNWRRNFSLKEIAEALETDTVRDISISSYTSTGRVKTLKILFEESSRHRSEKEIKATELRRLLGFKELPSTHFSLSIEGKDVTFEGKGFGHGVGLCQWGALEMARHGKNYREILAHYYPGATIKNEGDLTYQNLASKINSLQ